MINTCRGDCVMEVVAFIGPTGTGKSHRASKVAHDCGADVIIDDGLLIKDNKIIAGTSAKYETNKIRSVKKAIFADDEHALRSPRLVERLAELFDELAMQEVERVVGREIGELGHRLDDFGERHSAGDVAHDQGGHDALAKPAQAAFQAVLVGRGFVPEKLLHERQVQIALRLLAQPVGDFGSGFYELAQVTAMRQCRRPFGRNRGSVGFWRVGHVLV